MNTFLIIKIYIFQCDLTDISALKASVVDVPTYCGIAGCLFPIRGMRKRPWVRFCRSIMLTLHASSFDQDSELNWDESFTETPHFTAVDPRYMSVKLHQLQLHNGPIHKNRIQVER